MDVRNMRVRIAANAEPIVIDGRIKCANVPRPETGNHPSAMENTRINTGPSANVGNESPRSDRNASKRSCQRRYQTADCTPDGMDNMSATNSDASVNCNVAG